MIDESIDEALVARKNVIQKNLEATKNHHYHLNLERDNDHLCTKLFKGWNYFYVTQPLLK